MTVYFNTAGSNERFVSPTTLSLSATATTFCGRAEAGLSGGTYVEARAGAGTTVIQCGSGGGNFSVYNGSTVQSLAEPSSGTIYFWYIKLAGAGSNQIEFGVAPVGGSLTTSTHTLVNNSTIDRMWVGGDTFDPCDVKLDSFKVFASALSAGDLATERATVAPQQAAYIALPMIASTVAACALDSSGNGRDFTVNGSPAVVATLFNGTGAATLGIAASGAGLVGVTGTAAATLAISGSAAGAVTVTGTGAATLGITAAGVGTQGYTGTGSATLGITASATGSHGATTGTGAATLAVTAAGTGFVAPCGAGAAILVITGAGVGSLPFQWSPVAETAESWADVAATPETWTPVAETPETWSAA